MQKSMQILVNKKTFCIFWLLFFFLEQPTKHCSSWIKSNQIRILNVNERIRIPNWQCWKIRFIKSFNTVFSFRDFFWILCKIQVNEKESSKKRKFKSLLKSIFDYVLKGILLFFGKKVTIIIIYHMILSILFFLSLKFQLDRIESGREEKKAIIQKG